ncbi:hypothetical protein OROMI_004851 [Orobanche minor]
MHLKQVNTNSSPKTSNASGSEMDARRHGKMKYTEVDGRCISIWHPHRVNEDKDHYILDLSNCIQVYIKEVRCQGTVVAIGDIVPVNWAGVRKIRRTVVLLNSEENDENEQPDGDLSFAQVFAKVVSASLDENTNLILMYADTINKKLESSEGLNGLDELVSGAKKVMVQVGL